ncbi:MAG: toprim domain-containing protein [Bacteroidota bacterium]
MSTSIGDWLDNDVYPALFANADHDFPEFGFKRQRNGWISTTTVKADGSQGTQRGKVYFYENAKHCLKDYRLDKPVTLWRYIAMREGLTENKDIVQFFSRFSGVPLPDRPTVAVKKLKNSVHPAVLKSAHQYMQGCLQYAEEAEAARAYLQSRGYSSDDTKAMKLGFLPRQDCLKEHLLAAGHSTACIKYFMRKLQAAKQDKPAPPIGTSHQLMLPCFGANQRLEGFTFRTLQPDAGDKYLNMTGLKKSAPLLDFPVGTKDLTIVEGLFDAMLSKARGCKAVVPLNGTHLSIEQVEAMKGKGIRQLTLCLDNDEAGKKARFHIARKILQQCSGIRVFIAQLPEGTNDPDELISKQGIAAFQRIVAEAVNAGQYFSETFKARLVQYDPNEVNAKERDEWFDFCSRFAAILKHPQDRHDYVSAMSKVLPAMAYVGHQELLQNA